MKSTKKTVIDVSNTWFGMQKAMAEKYEQKDFTGSLFKNDSKQEDWHSDYKGSATIEGVEYWCNGFINESKAGNKYFGLTFKKKNG